MDFPSICRICMRQGDIRLFELEDNLLDSFESITKIDVRSTVHFPSNICHECIKKLEDISVFIEFSKHNYSKPGKNLILKIENEHVAIVDFGTSQEPVLKTEKTIEEYGEAVCTEKSEICRICLVSSCLTPFEEKAQLMQLFHSITNIKLEAASHSSSGNRICNKCINKLESISLFISLSLSNNMKIESTIAGNESLKTENCLEENAKLNNISDTKEVKVENYFNESVCSYESKDLHTVVDIKEEVLHSSEAPIRRNDKEGFYSETDSVEKPGCDPCKDEFSTKNQSKVISKDMEASLEVHARNKHFECNFNLKENFSKRHLLNYSRKRPCKCDCCGKSFTRTDHLKRHMRLHTGDKPFQCDSCEKRFADKSNMKFHMLTHTGEESFKCDFCKKGFTRMSHLKRHMRLHNGEKPFQCGSCEKRFADKSHLKSHMLSHTREKFKCDTCEKCFAQNCHLERHMLLHTGEKLFECERCKKRFSLKAHLKQHMLTHTGNKNFKCDSCKKGFGRIWDLREHMLVHTGEKTFKCDCCEKRFTGKKNLKQHMLTHAEKTLKCHCCKKGFTGKKNLRRHMLSHTGEKFQCDVCGKCFTLTYELKQHMFTHTGEKPFECNCCKKRFTSKGSLKRHMLAHAEGKPFKCDRCQKGFTRKMNLQRHMLTHTDFTIEQTCVK